MGVSDDNKKNENKKQTKNKLKTNKNTILEENLVKLCLKIIQNLHQT